MPVDEAAYEGASKVWDYQNKSERTGHACATQLTSKVIEDACKPLSESEVEPTKKVLNEALMDDH